MRAIPPELLHANKRTVETTGPPSDDDHDPSNIVRGNGWYYLWYTQHAEPYDHFARTRIECVRSRDGLAWEPAGAALGPGRPGSWDCQGALTAYVVPWDGRFFLFYTGIGPHYRDEATSLRGIGVAVADSPLGPWRRHGDGPVLWPSAEGWDDMACDDTNIIRREGKWSLYYKGRAEGQDPSATQLGLAVADDVLGPYHEHPAGPLCRAHAFSAWVHREGVALIAGLYAGQVCSWSTDGLHFRPGGPFQSRSTGFDCPESFANGMDLRGVSWGIDVSLEHPRHLYRSDCDLRP